ncbi:hypothetical protein GGR52DRAFT_567205 [Hypoxylon sp. FL1284]|nr:hypothetical protein GGR52DRAFT_567205 [Hypoxylon sp. FL1284]
MEPTATFQRNAALSSPVPVQALQAHLTQLRIDPLAIPSFSKGADEIFNTPRVPEPHPYPSPVSVKAESSFSSQGSSVDSWETRSSEPPSPHTPKAKREFDDYPRLGCITPDGGLFKQRHHSPEECGKKPQLPSFSCLLQTNEHADYKLAGGLGNAPYLMTPRSSPRPEQSYARPNRGVLPPSYEDPITFWLNMRRKESRTTKSALSQPKGLSNSVNPDPRPRPVFYREKQKHAAHFRSSGIPRQSRQKQPPSPPPGGVKKRRPSTKAGHCNIKYTIEELDFIRFNRYEMKLPWQENERRFQAKFPMADPQKDRRTSGIQSAHYRQNGCLPLLTDRGRRLVFEKNGHVAAFVCKVRDQRDAKPYYSLTYLYPERALLYDWVPVEYKRMAADLAKERRLQMEQAKREAIRTKEWRENLEPRECACCYKDDRVRDTRKRAAGMDIAKL